MSAPAHQSQPKSFSKHGRTFWIVSIACVVAFLVLFYFVDTHALHDWAEKLPGWLVFAFMAFLPVLGVPISLLLVIGGARFGAIGGLIASAFAIAVNLLLTFWVTKFVLRKPITAFFKKSKYKIPQIPTGEYVSVSLLTALVPGLPYAAKNYLLVLAGVPFRVFFWTCLPAHFFHASLGVLFGDFTKKWTPARIIFLIGYGIILTLLARRVVKRLRAKTTSSSQPGFKQEPAAKP